MSRIYYAPIVTNTITTAGNCDLFQLLTTTTNKSRLLGWEINSSSVVAQALELRLMRRSTAGTGGTALTEVPLDPDNTVTASVAGMSNIVTANLGSAGSVLKHHGWEQIGPYGFIYTPEMAPIITLSTALCLNLITAPTSFTLSGWVCWEEL